MKKIVSILLTMLTIFLSFSFCVSAGLVYPAHEHLDLVEEYGYDLSNMEIKILRHEAIPNTSLFQTIFFDEGKDNIDEYNWEAWYVDNTEPEEYFNNPANARNIAAQRAHYGENGIIIVYEPHFKIPGILCAGIGEASGVLRTPFTYVDAQKQNDILNYSHTIVTFKGDGNLDLKVDMKDILTIRKYVANMIEGFDDKIQMDCEQDEIVDLKDVLRLRCYVANSNNVWLGMFDYDVIL